MTDLVARVLLKADGSGLVGQVRESRDAVKGLGTEAKATGAAMATVAAPAAAAAAALNQAGAAATELTGAARQADSAVAAVASGMQPAVAAAVALDGAMTNAATGARQADAAIGALAAKMAPATAAANGLDGAMAKLRAELDPAGEATRRLAAATDLADTALARGVITSEQHTEAIRRATLASKDFAKQSGQARAATQDLGYQISDLGTSILGGVSPLRAFAQQSGQVAFALSGMGGVAGTVGKFFAGPWGALILIGVSALAPLVAGLFDTETAAKAAELATSGLGDAESALADIFGKTSSKIAEQNEFLRLNARLKAINLRIDAAQDTQDANKAFRQSGTPNVLGKASNAFSNVVFGFDTAESSAAARQLGARARIASHITDVTAQTAAFDQILKDAEHTDFKDSGVDQQGFLKAVSQAAAGRANKAIADLIDKSLDAGRIDPLLVKPGSTKKSPKPKKTPSTDGLVSSIESDIASITAAFTDAPTFIEKARAATARLDKDIAELGKKKPPNFQALIDQAIAAKGVIAANITKPYDDFIKDARQAVQVSHLIATGHVDEANALREVFTLQKSMGPLTAEQRDGVLATVQALRAEQREADILHEKQQKYLDALDSIKGAVRGVIFDGVDGIKDLPNKLISAFATLKGEQLFDKLFDGVFRDLQDQVTGTNVVKTASDRMAAALKTPLDPLQELAKAAGGAAAALNGSAQPGTVPTAISGGVVGGEATALAGLSASIGSTVADLLRKGSIGAVDAAGAAEDGDGPEIVVTARKKAAERSALSLFSDTISSSLKHIGISDEAAAKIGQFGGKAIEGAATGAFTNSIFAPLAKGLGLKTSKTGAELGGALAGGLSTLSGLGFLGGPIGGIASSILGSVVGGLFKKTPSGSAIVTGSGAPTVSGNKAGVRQALGADAASIEAGVQSIAAQLGADVGPYLVSIGKHKDGYRVSATGSASVSAKHPGATIYDGFDEAAAVQAAIGDAISDGAIQGISAAVQRALGSSPDIDKALKEALGVQQLEELIGGAGAALNKIFTTFDKTAEDRVRLAQTYGLDLLKVEETTAKQRADLVASTLRDRIGPLSDLLDDLSYGDLAEGSAADRRAKLLDKVASARADATAGVDGASATLAGLLRTLTSSSRDAFGTAGAEYGADRDLAQTAAQAVIQAQTDQVNLAAAQQKTVADAAVKQVALTDETNDLLAASNAKLDAVVAALGGASVGAVSAYDTASLADIR